MTLKLFVEPLWISPYVFACYVTLKEKNLDFEAVVVDAAAGAAQATPYLGQSVTGRVPSILDDDFGLAESSAIIEYLEQKVPEPPVLPSSLRDRARCRQLMSWIRSDETAALRDERSTYSMFFVRADQPLSPAAEQSAKKLCDIAGRVIRPGSPTIFDQWTILDAELAFILHRLILNKDPVPRGVAKWAERQWERPSVRAFLELARPTPSPSYRPPGLVIGPAARPSSPPGPPSAK
ncbi:MAG: glutathione transferase [Deltaproteobacteria bacterium]|nr:glutathione transferase [Deltaproteobacteria bacterium]